MGGATFDNFGHGRQIEALVNLAMSTAAHCYEISPRSNEAQIVIDCAWLIYTQVTGAYRSMEQLHAACRVVDLACREAELQYSALRLYEKEKNRVLGRDVAEQEI